MVNWRMQGNLIAITRDVKKKRPKATVYGIGDASHQSQTSDHNPYNWGYGVVCSAIDIMIRGGFTKADAAAVVKELRGRSDIQYLIYAGFIYSASYGWTKRRYTGSDPHNDHVHISAKHTSKADKDLRGLPGFTGKVIDGVVVKPKPAVKPAQPAAKAPDFPLGPNSYYAEQRTPTYRKGVEQFQKKLKERGWDIDVDGKFGADTDDVVRKFQREKKLGVDGKVGIKTWSAIFTAPVTK